MNIRITGDSVEIEGYVNAIERRSKPLSSRRGKFVERMCKGVFQKALKRNTDIRLLLNHDWNRDLGGTKDGTLELTEDNIGLRVKAKITDPDVVQKARNNDLIGWSFGFEDREVDEHDENGMPTRDVKDIDLHEVSILDRTKTPAYEGTLITVRSQPELRCYFAGEPLYSDIELRAEEADNQSDQPKNVEKTVDYSQYEKLIKEIKED